MNEYLIKLFVKLLELQGLNRIINFNITSSIEPTSIDTKGNVNNTMYIDIKCQSKQDTQYINTEFVITKKGIEFK